MRQLNSSEQKNAIIKSLKKHAAQYLMITPTVILVVLFGIYPVIYILYYSFMQYNGFSDPIFIGLYNYLRVFFDTSFWISVKNTLEFGIFIPLVQIPFALFLAALLNKKFKGSGIARAVIFVPNITSTAIMGIVFFLMFASYNGIVNGLLQASHIILKPIEWLGKGILAKLVVVVFCTWSGVGFYMVLFLAALQRIPHDVIESATIDGANSRQIFFKITIPMMGKMFQIISMLSILNTLKLFDSVKALTNGGPGNATDVMTMYIFRYFFENPGTPQHGYASAVSIVTTFIILIVTGVYSYFTRKMKDSE
ncbi:sugar ABC transporter permease [Treponema parvum]|uniref:Sugar ABC transporter permease n=1 Tax=Treponema parvum TaxID=138851 RepID=A0A975IEH9_9SPIR|nr:sugar ABC transporter permease [Treponema parvum]QTQ13842.1 sugar ABC transporter permease [Treponema parvum]